MVASSPIFDFRFSIGDLLICDLLICLLADWRFSIFDFRLAIC